MLTDHPLDDIKLSQLVQCACLVRETDQHLAAGKCFAVSLSLVLAAQTIGMHVALIRWDVHSDSEYADHWAIELDGGSIIDATSIQFDHTAQLVRQINDYPKNFVNPCRFAGVEFTEAIGVRNLDSLERLPVSFMYSCLAFRVWIMLKRSLRPFYFLGLCSVFSECTKGLLYLTLQVMMRGLQKRAALLKDRSS